MNKTPHLRRPVALLAAAGAALCFAPAWAGDVSTSNSTGIATATASTTATPAAVSTADAARETYARERAACLAGHTWQPRETCLKEAGAALAASRQHGAAAEPDQATLTANALRRCEAVAAADRYACQQMALGGGTVSGSVEAGGVLKEYVTTVPAER